MSLVLAKPVPTELNTPINLEGSRKLSVESHRNLFCGHYDECLNEAVKKGWNSFTCVRCPTSWPEWPTAACGSSPPGSWWPPAPDSPGT